MIFVIKIPVPISSGYIFRLPTAESYFFPCIHWHCLTSDARRPSTFSTAQEDVIKDLMSKENLRTALDIYPLPRWLVKAMRNPWVQDVEMSKENDLIQENWRGGVEPCGFSEEASSWNGAEWDIQKKKRRTIWSAKAIFGFLVRAISGVPKLFRNEAPGAFCSEIILVSLCRGCGQDRPQIMEFQRLSRQMIVCNVRSV